MLVRSRIHAGQTVFTLARGIGAYAAGDLLTRRSNCSQCPFSITFMREPPGFRPAGTAMQLENLLVLIQRVALLGR